MFEVLTHTMLFDTFFTDHTDNAQRHLAVAYDTTLALCSKAPPLDPRIIPSPLYNLPAFHLESESVNRESVSVATQVD